MLGAVRFIPRDELPAAAPVDGSNRKRKSEKSSKKRKHRSKEDVGHGGASWRMKAVKRAQEQASREGRKLDEVLTVQRSTKKVAFAKLKELAYIRQEIKNPLYGIVFMRNLMEDTELTEDQRQFVETSAVCERELRKILDNMDLESIEDGSQWAPASSSAPATSPWTAPRRALSRSRPLRRTAPASSTASPPTPSSGKSTATPGTPSASANSSRISTPWPAPSPSSIVQIVTGPQGHCCW